MRIGNAQTAACIDNPEIIALGRGLEQAVAVGEFKPQERHDGCGIKSAGVIAPAPKQPRKIAMCAGARQIDGISCEALVGSGIAILGEELQPIDRLRQRRENLDHRAVRPGARAGRQAEHQSGVAMQTTVMQKIE